MDRFNQPSNRVVSLRSAADAARFSALSQIEAYWHAIRGTRLMPTRSDINPRGLTGVLEYCFVLERVSFGIGRMRVAGSHLGDLLGMEVRGMPLSAYIASPSRTPFADTLEEVFQTPATAQIDLTAETAFGRPDLFGRMILLPVRSDMGDCSRILGGFVTAGQIGRAPRRFVTDHVRVAPLTEPAPCDVPQATRPKEKPPRPKLRRSAPPKWPDFDPQIESAPSNQIAEPPADFKQALPGIPYLRVVRD